MARGDEILTASKANEACKHFDVTGPIKKPAKIASDKKQQENKKDYGAWGPIFKDKKNFAQMHFC